MNKKLLGIDWGTSSRRAYLIDQDGHCLAEHEDNQGMLAVGARERYGPSLARLLATMRIGADDEVSGDEDGEQAKRHEHRNTRRVGSGEQLLH